MLSHVAGSHDFVMDFQIGVDKLEASAAVFGGGLVAGNLSAGQFISATDNMAIDANQRFIYNPTTGNLLFDSDGIGTNSAIFVAHVAGGWPWRHRISNWSDAR